MCIQLALTLVAGNCYVGPQKPRPSVSATLQAGIVKGTFLGSFPKPHEPESKLLKGAYLGNDTGEDSRGYPGDTGSLDYGLLQLKELA